MLCDDGRRNPPSEELRGPAASHRVRSEACPCRDSRTLRESAKVRCKLRDRNLFAVQSKDPSLRGTSVGAPQPLKPASCIETAVVVARNENVGGSLCLGAL